MSFKRYHQSLLPKVNTVSFFSRSAPLLKFSELCSYKLSPSIILSRDISHSSSHTYSNASNPHHHESIYNLDQHNQHQSSKSLFDATLSCTTININGQVTGISQPIPKARFLSENKLYARDLRSIDRTPVSIIPSILVRKNSILVNLLHIKAMIKYNKVLIFDTHDMENTENNRKNASKLSLFMYDLENKLQSHHLNEDGLPCTHEMSESEREQEANNLPFSQTFEMKALESILMNVMSTLETEMKIHVDAVNEILLSLDNNIDREILKELLIKNKALSKFYQKSLLIRNVINEVLDNDEDLVGMYLTEKHYWEVQQEKKRKEEEERSALSNNQKDGAAAATTIASSDTNASSKSGQVTNSSPGYRDLNDHDEIELLLESYYKQSDEIVQQMDQLLGNVKNTEEIINIILDANRNSLMLLEIKVTILTLGFTTGAFFAGLYGMNLENFIEETDYGFGVVTTSIIVVAAATTIWNLRKLVTVKKMTMMGTSPNSLNSVGINANKIPSSSYSMGNMNAYQSNSNSSSPASPLSHLYGTWCTRIYPVFLKFWRGNAAQRKYIRHWNWKQNQKAYNKKYNAGNQDIKNTVSGNSYYNSPEFSTSSSSFNHMNSSGFNGNIHSYYSQNTHDDLLQKDHYRDESLWKWLVQNKR